MIALESKEAACDTSIDVNKMYKNTAESREYLQ